MKIDQKGKEKKNVINMSMFGAVLLGICLFDLIGTVLGIHFNFLTEVNPILNYFLERWGLLGFILSKMFFVIVPISILEAALRFNLMARWRIGIYYRIAIFSYVFVLGGSILFQII